MPISTAARLAGVISVVVLLAACSTTVRNNPTQTFHTYGNYSPWVSYF